MERLIAKLKHRTRLRERRGFRGDAERRGLADPAVEEEPPPPDEAEPRAAMVTTELPVEAGVQPVKRATSERVRAYEDLFGRTTDPNELGRYAVLDKLGMGGMGVVLQAYDRELDRQVALKVLHPELDGRYTQRLRREAQAMAKLSHPNVVQVYEVGEIQGRTFVALELVKGQALDMWMRQRPQPSWRECVSVFLQLGAGLAAAHERGLVHRDFKPANAILDKKGRARVLDFGLARRYEEIDDSTNVRTYKSEAGPSGLDAVLTRSGMVLGTPAYMPPERMNGDEADARSDQFSFCVSLYEAVYGERPFVGRTLEALMVSVMSGAVRPAPRGSKIPGKLRAVLLRGLAVDPAQRWPSMEALLKRLEELVAPRRRRWLALSVGLVAVGGGLGATQTLAWMNRCTGARKQLEGTWNDSRRQEVKAAILSTGLSYASGTWERVGPRLDDFAEAWAAEYTDACEATRVRNEQSEEEMGLRMGCLHERWQHLRATVNELGQADATVVKHAVQAVASLPGLERCRDLEVLRAEVPPPEDPVAAEQVAALDELLVQAWAKEEAGKYEDALGLVDEAVEKGAGLDYQPLMARAWLRQGSLRKEKGDYEGAVQVLRKAYGAAVAHTMKAEAAIISAQLMYILGDLLARHEEARGWAAHAEPLSRAVGTDEARAGYLHVLGIVVASQGKYDDARDSHEQALASLEKALGPDHPRVASSLNGLGNVAFSQGKYDDARDFHERALAIWEKALGPDHPDIGMPLGGLGNVALSQGKYEDARDFYERALAIKEKALGPDHPDLGILLSNLGNVAECQSKYEDARDFLERALAISEKALGPDHPNVAISLSSLGNVAYFQGKYEDARDFHERALAIWEKALGPDHPNVAISLNNLGIVAECQGKYEDARDFHERALSIREKALGPDHPDVAESLNNLGVVVGSQGKHEDSRDFHERALSIREKTLGPDHPLLAASLTGLGEALLALAKPIDALPLLERALTICTTHDVDPTWLAGTRFALARALWVAPDAQDHDRSRARTLAEQARNAYTMLGDANKTELAEVRTWLAEYRLP